jgi:hypothetical protein
MWPPRLLEKLPLAMTKPMIHQPIPLLVLERLYLLRRPSHTVY